MKIANVTDWRTDAEKIAHGVPLDLGAGRSIIVKRAGTRNRDFMADVVRVNTEAEPEVMACYARTVVVGWVGMKDADGADVPYTVDNCVDLFKDCPEIFDRVQGFASSRANYSAEEQQAASDAVKVTPGG